MTDKIPKINPIAKTLRNNRYAPKKVNPKKGKGAYDKQKENKTDAHRDVD